LLGDCGGSIHLTIPSPGNFEPRATRRTMTSDFSRPLKVLRA
jgi:hypothetical protein